MPRPSIPGAQTHHSTHTEGQRQEEMTFIIHPKKTIPSYCFSLRKGLACNTMKHLLCGTEQYKTSILINSHFFWLSRMNGLERRGSERQLCRIRGGGARTWRRAPHPLRLLLDTDSHYWSWNRKGCKERGWGEGGGKELTLEAGLGRTHTLCPTIWSFNHQILLHMLTLSN